MEFDGLHNFDASYSADESQREPALYADDWREDEIIRRPVV